MKFSIISISFNDLDGLERTSESVQAQHLPAGVELEHIVVDAGTQGFAQRFPDAPATWSSVPDGGRYHGMNAGFERSTGDVIWWLHSGDLFGSNLSVRQAAAALDSEVEAQWGYGLARLTGPGGRVSGVLGVYPFTTARFSLGGQPVPHQAAFFRRGLVATLGGYDVRHGLAADQKFILAAAMSSDPVFVAEFLCDFDTSGAGSTRPVSEHFKDMRRAVQDLGYVHPSGRAGGLIRSRALELMRRGLH